MRYRDPEKKREEDRKWRENNREKLREGYRRYRENNKEKIQAQQKEYRERTREARKKSNTLYHRKRRQEIRNKIFDMLGGPVCKQCGYSEDSRALQIDHINGGGHRHRKSTSPSLYYAAILASGGEGFQVLCANCNQIKRYANSEVTDKKHDW